MRQIGALAMENCDRVVEEQSPIATCSRPMLTTLLREMKKGDTLVVWGFERLACSLADLNDVIAKLSARGITLHALRENFISTHPDSTPMRNMLRHLVEFNTFIAQERAVLSKVARDKPPLKLNPRRKMSDRDMQMISALIDEKISKASIAKKFGISEHKLNQSLRVTQDTGDTGEVILRPRRNPALRQRLRAVSSAPARSSSDYPSD
jgi:DNA invertase Pin-like site-specific DNA recombinase